MFASIDISASALAAQRVRLNVIANNIANVNSRDKQTGLPYRRQNVVFNVGSAANPATGVSVKDIVENMSQFPEKYDPTHPYADKETGIVQMTNVDPMVEMVDMIEATRAYEANVTAMEAAKSIVMSTFKIIA